MFKLAGFLSAFKSAMVDCDVIRNGNKIATHKGLINDTKDYNFISFEPSVDIQIGDDIYCPLKNKHYLIINTDLRLFSGKQHSLDAYFENNFSKPISTTTFNTYNPSNSVIGNQQNVVLNISNCYNNLQNQIEQLGNEDKTQLYELLKLLKLETSNGQINHSTFEKFKTLFAKHGPWLIPSIVQIITAWIQHG